MLVETTHLTQGPLAGFKGPTSNGMEVKGGRGGEEWEGKGWKGGEGNGGPTYKGREVKGWEGKREREGPRLINYGSPLDLAVLE